MGRWRGPKAVFHNHFCFAASLPYIWQHSRWPNNYKDQEIVLICVTLVPALSILGTPRLKGVYYDKKLSIVPFKPFKLLCRVPPVAHFDN